MIETSLKVLSYIQYTQSKYNSFFNIKGQLISKGVLDILNSPKKGTKEFDFTTMIPQIDLFSFVFWEKLKTPNGHSEIY